MALNINTKLDKIKCLQINLQHCKSAMSELVKTVNELNIDIVFANEPYYHNNKINNIPLKWKVIQSKKEPKAAIIFINDNLKPFVISSQISENIVWYSLEFMGKAIFLCSAYMSPSIDIEIYINEID